MKIKAVLFFSVLMVLVLLGALIYSISVNTNADITSNPKSTPDSVACTLDAKVCPDGSSVGRVAPKCEFAPCPTGNAATANWTTHSSARYKYSFKYPSSWTLYKYKEEDPSIQAGAHTLHSYDVNNVEKYMNHGIVDWQEFMPSGGTAIKLDITVGTLAKAQRSAYENRIMTNENSDPQSAPTKNAISDLKIDNLQTTQYTYQQNANLVTSAYIAYPNDNQIVQINLIVFYSSLPNYKNSQEWKDVQQVFSSFKFNQ